MEIVLSDPDATEQPDLREVEDSLSGQYIRRMMGRLVANGYQARVAILRAAAYGHAQVRCTVFPFPILCFLKFQR